MIERRERREIMLCYPWEESRFFSWNCPVIIQPKLDGHRCRAVRDQFGFSLYTSTGLHYENLEHIQAELDIFFDDHPDITELDGEIYKHNSSRGSIGSSIASEDLSDTDLEFHIFDIVDGTMAISRQIKLIELRIIQCKLEPENTLKYIKIISPFFTQDLQDIYSAIKTFTSQGYEGIVVRHPFALYERKRSTGIMKFKPRKQDVYRICGYKALVRKNGKTEPLIGSLECFTDGENERFFISGFTDKERTLFWKDRENLIGKQIIVDYQRITSKRKVPLSGIFNSFVSYKIKE